MSGLGGGLSLAGLYAAMGGKHDSGPRLDCLGAGGVCLMAAAQGFGRSLSLWHDIHTFVRFSGNGPRNPLAIPVEFALSWHHPGSGGHLREQGFDASQYAGLPGTAFRAGSLTTKTKKINRDCSMKKFLMTAAAAAMMLGAASASAPPKP